MKTDAEIKQVLLAQFKDDLGIRAKDVSVAVINGIVTLKGSVPSYGAKAAILGAAEHASGIVALAEEIAVNLPVDQRRSDADIATAAADAIKQLTTVPSNFITIAVRKGWLILTGTLETQSQKTAVEDAVKHLTGLVGVANMICVNSSPSPPDAKSLIPRRAPGPDDLSRAGRVGESSRK